MPTTRPRHVITETDDIRLLLDDAARRWPEDRLNRRKLLLRLVQEGHRAALQQYERHVAERREAIEATSGVATGAYGGGYLAELREDWPQ